MNVYDEEAVRQQSRSLIGAALNQDDEGVATVLGDIRDTGDIEAVALFLTGMLAEWMEYFSENPVEDWSEMMVSAAALAQQIDDDETEGEI